MTNGRTPRPTGFSAVAETIACAIAIATLVEFALPIDGAAISNAALDEVWPPLAQRAGIQATEK